MTAPVPALSLADQQLRDAIIEGNSYEVDIALDNGANPNLVFVDGGVPSTPLLSAIFKNRVGIYDNFSRIIRLLIGRGADVNLRVYEHTPLTAAIQMEDSDTTGMLLRYPEVDVNAPMIYQPIFVNGVAVGGRLVPRELTPVMFAIEEGTVEKLPLFFARPDFDLYRTTSDGRRADLTEIIYGDINNDRLFRKCLMKAVNSNNVAGARALLDLGLRANFAMDISIGGMGVVRLGPLGLAIQNRDSSMAGLLLLQPEVNQGLNREELLRVAGNYITNNPEMDCVLVVAGVAVPPPHAPIVAKLIAICGDAALAPDADAKTVKLRALRERINEAFDELDKDLVGVGAAAEAGTGAAAGTRAAAGAETRAADGARDPAEQLRFSHNRILANFVMLTVLRDPRATEIIDAANLGTGFVAAVTGQEVFVSPEFLLSESPFPFLPKAKSNKAAALIGQARPYPLNKEAVRGVVPPVPAAASASAAEGIGGVSGGSSSAWAGAAAVDADVTLEVDEDDYSHGSAKAPRVGHAPDEEADIDFGVGGGGGSRLRYAAQEEAAEAGDPEAIAAREKKLEQRRLRRAKQKELLTRTAAAAPAAESLEEEGLSAPAATTEKPKSRPLKKQHTQVNTTEA